MISYEEVDALLHYEPDSGLLRWKQGCKHGKVKSGDVAGSRNKDGYIVIGIKGKRYYAHRLAWLLYYGEWPEKNIDHKDREKDHNWISNLRDVSQAVNNQNISLNSSNTSGVMGVSWNVNAGKWRAFISINNKQKHLGYFVEFNTAVEARKKAESKVNGSSKETE